METLEDLALWAVLKCIKDIGELSENIREAFAPLRRYLRITNTIRSIRKHESLTETGRYLGRYKNLVNGRLYWRNQKIRVYNFWILTEAHDTTHLSLPEILDVTSLSASIFDFIVKSREEFKYLKFLSLSSKIVTGTATGDSFVYESEDPVLKHKLASLKKCPNLSDLHINAFCDDEILTEIIGTYLFYLPSWTY